LQKIKFVQTVRVEVLSSHKVKNLTPTLGAKSINLIKTFYYLFFSILILINIANFQFESAFEIISFQDLLSLRNIVFFS
ncbi:MAG: hypothetical protein ACOCOG_06220, partial [Prevotella sp.]